MGNLLIRINVERSLRQSAFRWRASHCAVLVSALMCRKPNRFFLTGSFKWPIVRMIFVGPMVLSWLSGCAIPNARPASATRDRAFIEYWPPSNDSKKLRLAVKDLIDMKGVVTTAGSEFLAKHASP